MILGATVWRRAREIRESLIKGIDRGKLHQEKKTVTRKGKTFTQTVWKRTGEDKGIDEKGHIEAMRNPVTDEVVNKVIADMRSRNVSAADADAAVKQAYKYYSDTKRVHEQKVKLFNTLLDKRTKGTITPEEQREYVQRSRAGEFGDVNTGSAVRYARSEYQGAVKYAEQVKAAAGKVPLADAKVKAAELGKQAAVDVLAGKYKTRAPAQDAQFMALASQTEGADVIGGTMKDVAGAYNTAYTAELNRHANEAIAKEPSLAAFNKDKQERAETALRYTKEREDKALASVATKEKLTSRLKDAIGTLADAKVRATFSGGYVDEANKRMISRNGQFVAQWQTRTAPSSPEGTYNQQTTSGHVAFSENKPVTVTVGQNRLTAYPDAKTGEVMYNGQRYKTIEAFAQQAHYEHTGQHGSGDISTQPAAQSSAPVQVNEAEKVDEADEARKTIAMQYSASSLEAAFNRGTVKQEEVEKWIAAINASPNREYGYRADYVPSSDDRSRSYAPMSKLVLRQIKKPAQSSAPVKSEADKRGEAMQAEFKRTGKLPAHLQAAADRAAAGYTVTDVTPKGYGIDEPSDEERKAKVKQIKSGSLFDAEHLK